MTSEGAPERPFPSEPYRAGQHFIFERPGELLECHVHPHGFRFIQTQAGRREASSSVLPCEPHQRLRVIGDFMRILRDGGWRWVNDDAA